MTILFYIILVLSVPAIHWHWGWFGLSFLLCVLEGCGSDMCKKKSMCCENLASSGTQNVTCNIDDAKNNKNLKKAVIYYSFEGNTRLMAENIAQMAGADLLELRPKKEIGSKGFMKYVWGGKAAMMKEKPELLPFDKDIQEYDVLFIGTPVWAWTYAPPFNTFFEEHSLLNKKIALFCCHGGGKGNIFEKMSEALKGNQILGEIDFQDPLKKETKINIQKAKTWAETITEKL